MPHISDKRLHTAAYMLRVLSRAGQFAHVAVRSIEQDLASLYTERGRSLDDNCYSREAVSDELYGLYRARVIPKMYPAANTIRFLTHRHGSLCALCRDTAFDGMGWGTARLSFFVAPTFLHVQNNDSYALGCLCRNCFFEMPPTFENREAMVASLTVLITRKRFLHREAEHRDRWMRFDPCRIGLKGELKRIKLERPFRHVQRRRLAAMKLKQTG
jgi:hypothetical protein